MDVEKIKEGLKCCGENEWCAGHECPYYEIFKCQTSLARDALALVQKIERENMRLHNIVDTFFMDSDVECGGNK